MPDTSKLAQLEPKPNATQPDSHPPIIYRNTEQSSQPLNPNHPPPLWTIWIALLLLAASIIAIVYYLRKSALRAWKRYALEIGGEFRPKNDISPLLITGEIQERPFILEAAMSHEDEAGYYHTRGRMPIKNRGSFILGLRHKSLLELTQTRKEPPAFDLEDHDFERQFFVFCNDTENLTSILTPDARRELIRYADVEIYARMGEIEWRRAGEISSLKVIRSLNQMLLQMANTIDSLPARGRSLTQCLADEKTIEKGI